LNLGGGIGGLLNLKHTGQNYAYLYDGKGNVEAVLDNTQSVVAAYRYDPFGKLLAKTGTLDQPFGFSTKRYDAQTGLIEYGFRRYAPAIGRWTTRDPLGETGGINLYAFVGNNPVNWVDPWGLEIINYSDDTVYYKPENDSSALPIAPHTIYGGTQDGFAIPCLYPGQVFKTITGVDVIIHEDGSIELIAKSEKQAVGQSAIGAWKDLEWNLFLQDVKGDYGWDALFKRSLKASKEICEESKKGCK
jgi:RHS repeat-associated protein